MSELAGRAAYHIPVLLSECLDLLAPKPNGTYLDATLGGGSHARAILSRLGSGGKLIGLDRDADAVGLAETWRKPYGERFEPVRGSFGELRQSLRNPDGAILDGALFDLGVSSHQLDVMERGFSFRGAGPLDMRMDTRGGVTAAEIIQTWPENEIAGILREFGEERYSGRIAKAIVRERTAIDSTADLADVIKRAVPGHGAGERIHPATRSFQALRLVVNDELGSLSRGLEQVVLLLKPGGRIVVISYHSLEDRIVKNLFRDLATGCTCPPRMPMCVCGHTATLKLITRKSVKPSDDEVAENPRARSARLRAAERLP